MPALNSTPCLTTLVEGTPPAFARSLSQFNNFIYTGLHLKFHDQLTNILRGEKYRKRVPNLQSDDLVWLVDYLTRYAATSPSPFPVPC